MKPDKTVDRIERALWQAGSLSEPYADRQVWHDGVMAEIRKIGPLEAKSSGRVYEPVMVWPWAAAIAACLVIGICGYALSDMHTDAIMAGLFLDDPAGLTVNTMLVEM